MADQLGRPEIRSWEVTSNTTRYEKLLAAPSDEALRIMWSGWAAVGGVLCVFVVVVFLSILFSPKARENPFNVYICGLMVPDIVFGILCSVTCALNASKGEYFAEWMCRFQSFYTVWSVSSSAWLNGIVSWQLYTMLASSHIRMRYKPPPIKTVIKHACIVYIYSAFLASFGLYDISWLPHKTTGAVSGMGCIPLEFSLGSSLFYFLVFLPLMAGIPLSYVIWICYDIWKRKLMPPSGRRRLLFIYFIRIIASFIIMWVPFLVLVFIAGNWPVSDICSCY